LTHFYAHKGSVPLCYVPLCYGWWYLFSFGLPSLWSAIKDNGEYVSYNGAANVPKHNTHWFEIHANVKAYDYFKKKGKIDTWEEEKKYPLY